MYNAYIVRDGCVKDRTKKGSAVCCVCVCDCFLPQARPSERTMGLTGVSQP